VVIGDGQQQVQGAAGNNGGGEESIDSLLDQCADATAQQQGEEVCTSKC